MSWSHREVCGTFDEPKQFLRPQLDLATCQSDLTSSANSVELEERLNDVGLSSAQKEAYSGCSNGKTTYRLTETEKYTLPSKVDLTGGSSCSAESGTYFFFNLPYLFSFGRKLFKKMSRLLF